MSEKEREKERASVREDVCMSECVGECERRKRGWGNDGRENGALSFSVR